MLKRLSCCLLFAASLASAQALPTISLPSTAIDATTNMVAPVSTMFAKSFSYAVPFGAAAGNFAPLNYHFLIPLLDIYLTAPIIVAAGKIDFTALDAMSNLGAAANFKTALGPLASFAYLPLPMLAVTAKARLQLPIPIVKDIELDLKFGFVPQAAKDVLSTALAGMQGFSLNYDSTLFGIGARYRVINTKLFTLGAGLMVNTLKYSFDLGFTTPKQSIGSFTLPGGGTMQFDQAMALSLTNEFNSTVLSLDAQAGLNLFIFQLYAGLGLNFDLTGAYTSSYGISGTAYSNNVAMAAQSIGGKVTLPGAPLVPKFSVGFRLSILDVQAESTFDLQSVAARAGIAVSF